MKKSMSSILLIVLALSLLLVGCASNQEANTTDVSEKSTEINNQTNIALDKRELSEKVTIKFWEKEGAKFDEKLMNPLIEEFQKKYPNIKVERTHMGIDDLRQNTQTAFMGGNGPDVVWSPFDHIGPFSVMGIAQPLDDLISDELKNRYIDSALPGMSLNGHIYGIPVTMGNHLMLYYNKDLVNKVPETWQEVVAIAKDLTIDKDGDGQVDQYGLVYNLNEPFWWVIFQGGYGGWVMDENNKPTLNTEATKDAMQFVHDLKFKHQIVPREADYNLADSLFKEGKAAFTINGIWELNNYINNENINTGVAVLPKFQKTGKYAQPMTSGAGFIMMTELSEAKQIAVIKFIEFMTSQKSQKRMVKEFKRLPSNKAVYELPIIKEDPVMRVSGEQLRKGRPMPVITEMRAIWDAIRPALQDIMADKLSPEEAAAQIQSVAKKKIKEMQ